MSHGPLAFVHAVRRRLAWRAGLRTAARSGAVMAGPALACCLAGWWFGWALLGPAAAVVGGLLTLAAAVLAWRRAPGLDGAAVAADRALGLPGLLTTATAHAIGERPAGFAGAVASRASEAIRGRRAAQVVGLGRTVLREGGVALVALALVAAAAGVPSATATQRASARDAQLHRATALLELARSVQAGGDDALADAIRRAGRSLAAPANDGRDLDPAGVEDPGALAALEQQIAQRRRASSDARAALREIDAGNLKAAADLTGAGTATRAALDDAAAHPEGSAARAAALDAAVSDLETQAAGAEGMAGLRLTEAAARVRTARASSAGDDPSVGSTAGSDAGQGVGTAAGAGRDPATAPASAPLPAPSLSTRLAAAAPRVMARPVWDPRDDLIVKRYFDSEVNSK